jgi:hypothetical protein
MVSRVSGFQNQGARKRSGCRIRFPDMQQPTLSRFSFIRTVTVGPGIAPDLLTLFPSSLSSGRNKALAGFRDESRLPPVGNFAPP